MKWTFFLRQGVKWHRGYGELTSDDVRFTFERHLDPKTGSLERANYEIIQSIETPDRYTVIFNLKEPTGYFKTLLAWQTGFIQSRKYVTERLDAKADLSKSPIGTGPYVFERYDRGSEVVLTANGDYFGAKPQLPRIRFRVIREELIAVKAVERGDVHVTETSSPELVKSLPSPVARLVRVPSTRIIVIAINAAKKPFEDVRVRRALAYAFDLEAFGQAGSGAVEIYPTFLPKGLVGSTIEHWIYKYNLDRAKQLLTEAGYPSGIGKVVLMVEAQGDGPRWGQIMKDLLSKVADVEIRVAEPAQIQDMIRRSEWDLYQRGLTRNDPAEYTILFASGSAQNFGKYSYPGMDDLILKGRRAVNARERAGYYNELQKIVADQVFGIYPGMGVNYLYMNSRLQGVYPHAYPGVASYATASFGTPTK
jgi:peptide/nickel transport system substrate-binding protein